MNSTLWGRPSICIILTIGDSERGQPLRSSGVRRFSDQAQQRLGREDPRAAADANGENVVGEGTHDALGRDSLPDAGNDIGQARC